MAIIVDPDNLALTTDVVIDTVAKTIEVKTTGAVTNAGSTGGVTLQCLYSWLKEQWKTSSTFIKFPFPMEAITAEQFEFINGWRPLDDTTRNLLRNAGWAEKNNAGAVLRKYMGVVSLGSIGGADQPYFRWNSGARTNFAFAGPINQAVQIFGDADNGNFAYDDGGDTFTIYVREQGKTYASSNNTSIGAPTLNYQVYRFPLSNAVDINIIADDATINTTAPYTDITVEFFGTDQPRFVDSATVSRPFRIIVTDGSGVATTRQIYEKIQFLLRQNSDIDSGAGTVIGATAEALFSFRGDTLVGATSVHIDDLNSNFLNAVELYDQNGVMRLFPFVAAGTINFGAQAGVGDFKFWMFQSSGFGTASAVIVEDRDGNPIEGTFAGSPVPFSFAYDTYNEGGHTAGTDLPVTLVGIGLSGGQYTSVTYTITRTQGQSILLAPAQERNYSNP